MAEDFTLSGSENSIDLTNPANTVPAPPVKLSVAELESQLAQAEELRDLLNDGYEANKSRYPTRSAYDKAKRENLALIQKTLPGQIEKRKDWENRYAVKRGQVGEDTVVLTATQVYDIQQKYKAVTTAPSPGLKRYLDAVKNVEAIQKKIDTPGTRENQMSEADQALMVATAWNQARGLITPEVEKTLGQRITTVVDEYGRTVNSAPFVTPAEADSAFESTINRAMQAADRQFSTQVVETADRWGRPLTYTRIRDDKQSADFAAFENKINRVVSGQATPQEVATTPATVTPQGGAPGQENRGAMTGRLGQQAATPAAATQDRQFAGTRPVTAPRVAAETVGDFRGEMTGRLEAGLGARTPATGGTGTGGAGTGGTGTGGTGGGGTGGGTGVGTGAGGLKNIDGTKAGLNWEENIRKYFPKQAWLLDEVDRGTNQDLFDLLKEYSVPRPLTKEELAIFDARLENTGYYKNLATSGKIRDIKKVVGDLGFDTTDFTRFVNRAINLGWEGERLAQETYKEVFSTNPDGSYINPVAAQRALKSNDYLGLAKVSREYFNPVGTNSANTRILRVLTGEQNQEDFVRQERELAKQRYGHLSSLIDQGLTLEDIASNYKRTAASILERDENSIDMTQADYEIALRFGEEGKQRVMTNGEWERLLRTDPRYGWEKTENAKAEARSLANTVVQAFGRII